MAQIYPVMLQFLQVTFSQGEIYRALCIIEVSDINLYKFSMVSIKSHICYQ